MDLQEDYPHLFFMPKNQQTIWNTRYIIQYQKLVCH
nr:MAG TPA_asm: hypothetical protein [Caudoviricetes sp.]